MLKKVSEQGYYVIAEIGVNYYDIARKLNIDLIEAAKLMITEAKKAGIDAVKFQSYKADKLASRNSPSYWDTREEPTTSQYQLFKKFDSFGEKEYKVLAEFCWELGIDFLSTPFDFEAVDYLENLVPAYKISSSDITNIPFIRYIAKKKKTILVSTGASNFEEIREAVYAIESEGVKDLVILHCVLEYPTPFEHANLNMITSIKAEFPNYVIGYSDHTRPDYCMDVIKTAWLLGAPIIEKHFTLDKTLKGNDHYHAMDPSDFRKIKEGLEFIKMIRGKSEKRCLDTETTARINARRSVVANRDIPMGTVLTQDMITFKRPGLGIKPSDLHKVVGRIAKENISNDTILQYEMFK